MDAELPKTTSVSFPEEFRSCWRQIPDKRMFFGLFAAWVLLFQLLGNSTFGYTDNSSVFGWLWFVSRTSADDGHCVLIPFVVLALCWWKRQELLAVRKTTWWPGLLLLAGAVLLHVLGFAIQQARISLVAFGLGAGAIMALTWGIQWLRSISFPAGLLVFSVPLGTLSESITFPLRLLVTKISVVICSGVLGIDLVRDGVQIIDAQGGFHYDVAAACSGIRSLTALLALTTIYGFVNFSTWWKKWLMVFLAVPLAVLGNVIRLIVIITMGKAFGQEAGMFVHDWFGFVTFAVAIGCVLGFGHWLREDGAVKATEGGTR